MPQDLERRKFLKFLLSSGIVVTLGGNLAFLPGCGGEGTATFEDRYDFLDHLDEAGIATSNKNWVRKSAFAIKGERRNVLFEHPDSQVVFKKVPIYKNAVLKFGIGIHEKAWKEGGDGVLFEVIVTDKKGSVHNIYSRYINPKSNERDQNWFNKSIYLSAFQDQKVTVAFKTSGGPKKNLTCDWAGWSKPEIVSQRLIKPRKKKHTNVILISIDTLRPDHLGCYGHRMKISPWIDQLAKRGIIFKNAIAQSPWTLPSHMSILTSLYPSVHLAGSKQKGLSEEKICLAEILKGEGYHTAAFVDGGYLSHKYGYSQGFDIYDDEKGHIAKINKKVMKFLEGHYREKFFLFMHVYDVHGPYRPPSPYNNMYYKGNKKDPDNHSMDFIEKIDYHKYQKFGRATDINYFKSLYAGEVSYVDNHMGKLFVQLEKLGISENTLIIFLSDHGESLFEHHIYMGHGIFLYDNEIKIPLIMKLPENNYANNVINNQVESIDVMPTILDLLNISGNKEIQGKSLLKLIKDKRIDKDDNFAFGESSNSGGTPFIRTNKWKFIARMKNDLDKMIKVHLRPTGKIDLAQYIIEGEQLYDLENDPLEMNNLVGKEAGVANDLRNHLEEWEENNKKIAGWPKNDKRGALPKTTTPGLTKEEKQRLLDLGYVQ